MTNRVGYGNGEGTCYPTPFGWEIINGPAYSTPADDLSNVFTWWHRNQDSEYLPQRRPAASLRAGKAAKKLNLRTWRSVDTTQHMLGTRQSLFFAD